MQHKNGLGTQPRYLKKLNQAGRCFCQKLLMSQNLSSSKVFFHLLGDGFSHPGNGLQSLLPADFCDVFRQRFYGPGSFAEGYDLEAVLGM